CICHFNGFIGGIVEYLNFELLARILHLADGIHQAINDKLLIENGQLYSYPGQISELLLRRIGAILAVLVIKIDKHIAVDSIRRQDDEDREIRNEQREIKSIRPVKAFKRCIGKMGLKVVRQSMRRNDQTQQ